MITAYVKTNGHVTAVPLSPADSIPPETVWIDALRRDDATRFALGQALGIDLPTTDDMHEIEASSRTYMADDALFVTAPIISDAATAKPKFEPISFILQENRLVTIRLTETGSLTRYAQKLVDTPNLPNDPPDILIDLIDSILDRLADLMEVLIRQVETMSADIFKEDVGSRNGRQRRAHNMTLQSSLLAIGRDGRMLAKIRTSLTGFERVLGFLNSHLTDLSPRQIAAFSHARHDTASLIQQADFQEQQINFLLDATVGLITIEQTDIVRVLSIAAAMFLPPTLIASLYGMNFSNMPELSSPIGYPLVLLAMVVSVVAPLWYFRRKGWM